MSKVTMDYFGVEGTGRNVTEAKRDAGAKIEAAMKMDYRPVILRWRGLLAIVSASPTAGYGYKCFDALGDERETLYLSTWQSDDRDEVILSAWRQLAQQGYRKGETAEQAAPPAILASKSEMADLRSMVSFWTRCDIAKAKGMNDNDAHSYACRNPCRSELWIADEKLTA